MKVQILLFILIFVNVYGCTTADEPPPVILVAGTKEIVGISISSGVQAPIIKKLSKAVDVDYNYEEQQIFYSDFFQSTISV